MNHFVNEKLMRVLRQPTDRDHATAVTMRHEAMKVSPTTRNQKQIHVAKSLALMVR